MPREAFSRTIREHSQLSTLRDRSASPREPDLSANAFHALREEDLIHALDALAEIVEIICAPTWRADGPERSRRR
ncbi:MAG: hypothetical protein AB7T06_00240 [Kofleriaceae bacterium]